MRLKDKSVNIDNLKPVIKDRLPDLDKHHQYYTNEEVVVTSGNDGEHMIDSLHYKDLAIDIRRWYYDMIPEPERAVFRIRLNRIFPPEQFDIVYYSPDGMPKDCIHIEYDPVSSEEEILDGEAEVLKNNINMRSKSLLQPNEFINEKPIKDLPKVKELGTIDRTLYYTKKYFAPVCLVAGGALQLVPEPAIHTIGQGLVLLSGYELGKKGLRKGKEKTKKAINNRKKPEKTKADKPVIKQILDILIKIAEAFQKMRGR